MEPIMCQICGKVPIEGAIPSETLRPRPIYVCGSCAKANSEVVKQYGFPIFHFRNGLAIWYFIFLDEEDRPFISSFDYEQSRPRRFPSWDITVHPFVGWLNNDFPGFVQPLYPMRGAWDERDNSRAPVPSCPEFDLRPTFFWYLHKDGLRYSISDSRDYHGSCFYVENLRKTEATTDFELYTNPRELYALNEEFVAEYIKKQAGLFYFAYGADMDRETFPSQLYPGDYKKVPDNARLIRSILHDYSPSFSRDSSSMTHLWKGGILDLTEEPGECTQGVLYDLNGPEMDGFLYSDGCSADCFSYYTPKLRGMKRKGEAKYILVDVWVEGDDGTYPAKMFCSGKRTSKFVKPSKEYMTCVMKGTRAFYGFSEYTHRLNGLAKGYSCSYRDGSHRLF